MASTAATTGSDIGDDQGRNKLQRALSELSNASGLHNVQSLYTLKACFQTQQDPESTQEAVAALLFKLQGCREDYGPNAHEQHVHAVTSAALGALSTILSTIQSKSLRAPLVHEIYALSASTTPTPSADDTCALKNDAHALAKLKILELALSKSALMPEKKTLETLITTTVREACFFQSTPSSRGNYAGSTRHANDAAPTTRIAVPTQAPVPQLSMGAFRVDPITVNTARAAHQPRRQQSSASLSSRRSRATSSASESEQSDASSRSTRGIRRGAPSDDAFTIRTEGLRCLCALAKLDSKALHQHWPLYVPSSPAGTSLFALASSDVSLAVRMAALQALRALLADSTGYMALAREAPPTFKATSFTPLSQTIAEMAESINVHTIRLLELYLAMRKAKEILVATVQLAQVVVLNSPYERLASPHLPNVLGTVLPYVAGLNETVVMRETSALLALIRRNMASSEHKNLAWHKAAHKAVRAILDQLQDMEIASDKDRAVYEAKWTLLAELLHLLLIRSGGDGELPAGLREAVQQLVQNDISHRPEKVAEIQIDALGACLHVLDRADMAYDWLPDTLGQLLDHAIKTPLREAVRVKIAALFVENVQYCDAAAMQTAASLVTELAESADKAIRLQVYRLLGLLLASKSVSKSDSDAAPHESILARSFRILLNGMALEPSTAARAEAAWNTANLMESTFSNKYIDGHTNINVEVAKRAMAAVKCEAASRDAEMLRISGVRILGQVVSGYPSLRADIRQLAIASLVNALQTSSAKTRWNVATAMKAILLADPAEPAIVDALLVELQTSDNIKVKACALSALDRCDKLSKQVLEAVLQDVEERKPTLAFSELGRAEALQQTLREAVAGKFQPET